MTWTQICTTYVPPRARKDTAMKKKHSILFDALDTPSGEIVPEPHVPPVPALRRGLTAMDAMQRGTAEEDLDDFGFDDMLPPAVPPPEKKPRLSSAAEIAATTSGKKSMCPFGRRCYRKNPAHFLEFEHPWRDVENEKDEVLPAPPEDVKSFADAAAGLFDAETQILCADARQETREVPKPSPDSAMPHSSESAPVPPVPVDSRLVAVRNLLKSMLEDAGSPELRKHFERMIEFADSVPSTEAMPKAAQVPARSLASALLSTTSEGLGVDESREPRGETESDRNREESDPKAHVQSELSTMGFAKAAIQEALVHCNTTAEAVDWLLAHDA